ncbi:hypothetical protein IC628_16955 [Photobacterium damselae subsp. piscicida]|uniref:hypothetical protein n=1 Tax=Photobacterium damselae TaxID=38293 RepID=UPI0017463EB9|nr:hypothetical protein [Photobacterium damselae]MDP2531226.1 hypothetical protein [Photobacterium damselae subsp. piscicida]QOD54699.1 hypothetical protein IC628_16955 [Photobacterium damselae subsp. piscicida]
MMIYHKISMLPSIIVIEPMRAFPVVTPIDLLMVKFTFYKRSNNLIVHLFAFRKTNGFSY